MYILNPNIKWRVERNKILICDCKRLIDLKTSFDFKESLKNFMRGFYEEELSDRDRLLFLDFKKLQFLSKMEICPIDKEDFSSAMKLLDAELPNRKRTNRFLFEKFKKFPKFFIGVFIDKTIRGLICGFPREDYLLMSEIAVDARFQRRRFGEKLVKAFEEVVIGEGYAKINVGAEDSAIGFYLTMGYKPFLLVQYKKREYGIKDFSDFEIFRKRINRGYAVLEVRQENADLRLLENLRKKYPKAYFQYIFTKKI